MKRVVVLALIASLAACQRVDRDREWRRAKVRAEMRERKAQLGMLLEQADMLRMERKKASVALPSEAELPALFARLQTVAQEKSVQMVEWRRENEQAIGELVEVGLDLELEGSFVALVSWLEGVREGGRVVVVDDIVIGNRKVEEDQVLLRARIHLVTYRLAEEDSPPIVVPYEIDKEFADDPEIRRLVEETRDLESMRAVVEDLRRRWVTIEEILGRGKEIPTLLVHLSRLESTAWFEGITVHQNKFTIEGGAPRSADVVQFMNLVQATPGVRDLALMSERKAIDPTGKREYRAFSMTGELAPD